MTFTQQLTQEEEEILGIYKPQNKARSALLGNSAISSHLLELGYPEKSINSMLRCGQDTGQLIFMHCNCTAKVIPLKHHCNLRTCVECSKLRKRRLRKRYYPLLSKVHQDRKNKVYFLTISPQNYISLEHGLKEIRKNLSKFLRHDYIKERVKGGIYVIEAKNPSGTWNIHLHCIVYGRFLDNRIRGKCLQCGQNYIKFDSISKKYYCANRKCNSQTVVFRQDSKLVSLWKQSAKQEVNMHVSDQGSTMYSLNYMLKYISANKDDFLTNRDMAQYILATRKLKLISTFGFFYKNKIVKLKPICLNCASEIHFIFDMQLMTIYRDKLQVIPPPLQQLCD